MADKILLEVVLAIFTGGMGNAAKWLGKLGKVAPKLVAVFQRIVKSVDKAIPDKLKRKDRDADEKGELTPEKQQALLAAKVITEKHDAANSSIAVLKASLLPIKQKYKSVKRFEVEHIADNHYKVWMIASKKLVDGDYSEGEGKKSTDMSALWPWTKKTASIAEMTAGGGKCEIWATKLKEAIGGDIIKIVDKYGAKYIGKVYNKDGKLITAPKITEPWVEHFAVRKGDIVYDKITGPLGMLLEQYKKLFEYGEYLNFDK